MKKEKDFVFGVFTNGKLVFALKRETCTHAKAVTTISIYNLAKDSLEKNHYFAYDYAFNVFKY